MDDDSGTVRLSLLLVSLSLKMLNFKLHLILSFITIKIYYNESFGYCFSLTYQGEVRIIIITLLLSVEIRLDYFWFCQSH